MGKKDVKQKEQIDKTLQTLLSGPDGPDKLKNQ